jgi:hypothetical protein
VPHPRLALWLAADGVVGVRHRAIASSLQVDAPSRDKFDVFFKALLKKEVPEILSTPGAPQPVFADMKLTKAPPVDKGTVFDCCFDQTRGWAWVEWTKTVPEYSVPKGAKYGLRPSNARPYHQGRGPCHSRVVCRR